MAVRSQHSRQSKNTISLQVNGIFITLMGLNWEVNKSYLYSIKKRIINNKISIPNQINQSIFLVGECSKNLDNGVKFYWN